MKKIIIFFYSFIILLTTACTFDYGESTSERDTPDLVMQNVEYVRVRSSDPIARFTAERAERYEKKGVMILKNFSFEQYGEKGEEVNAIGSAGYALVEIESGDVSMDDGVRIEVESEDIILETKQLEWKDDPRILTSGRNDEVNIFQESGTHFIGIGLRVETRTRKYDFSGYVHGLFIPAEDEEEEEDDERTPVRAERPVIVTRPEPVPEKEIEPDMEEDYDK